MKHVPNALTVGRIAVTPLCLWGLASGRFWGQLGGTLAFMLAAISDYWDGRLARQYGVRSRFGAFLDPLADKVLVLGAFFVLMTVEPVGAWMPLWAVALVAARDVAVTVLRWWHERQGRPLRTTTAAKWKTAAQLAFLLTIQVLLTVAHARHLPGGPLRALGAFVHALLDSPFTLVFLLVTVAATLYTGALYFLPERAPRPAVRPAPGTRQRAL
jgi:CDP-diacylglycerol--glycerol-3-phosphate 3-phosphatidyltransferase